MRWRLDDAEIFRAVVEQGGITAAALLLDMPKSTVSKALARLEQDLGVVLIERTSRRIRVTSEGQAFRHRIQILLDMAQETDAMMQGLRAVPEGRVALGVPPAFCREWLAPRLPDFAQACPRVRLEIVTRARAFDLASGEVDMAVVVGPQPDSGLAQKVLMEGRLMWIASPAYAAAHDLATDDTPDPVHIHLCETRYARDPLPLHVCGQAMALPPPVHATRIDDPLCVREAVAGGMGVSFLPERYCHGAITRGELIEVWPQAVFDQGAARLAVVYPGSRLLAPRHRAVLDFLERIGRG